MKCSDCKNYKVRKVVVKRKGEDTSGGICTVNNTACDPGDECKTGLFDKIGVI